MSIYKAGESVFRAYDVRGIYPTEVNEWLAKKIGNQFPSLVHTKKILVGYDMRTSSLDLYNALVDGLRLRGVDVYSIGMCSSPMFYYACAFFGFKGGIMVTASHNPKQFNGFKFVGKKAKPIGLDNGLKKLKKRIKKRLKIKDSLGKHIEFDITDDYKLFLEEHIENVSKLKVIVDSGNGMGGIEFNLLKDYLKITNINLKPDGNFPHHTPNPIERENIEELCKKMKRSKADLGIAFDGDADRVVFVDEKGEPIKSDYILALLTHEVASKGDRIVYDLRMSDIISDICKVKKIKAIKSKVGHSNVTNLMKKQHALYGGELSGHYYFKDNYYADSGILAAIKVLNIMSERKMKISELVKPFEKYYTSDEINFKVKNKDEVVKKFKKWEGKKDYLDGVTIRGDDYWFNIRKSNTEDLIRLRIEGRSIERVNEILEKIKKEINAEYYHHV